jgi:hypothetical protein
MLSGISTVHKLNEVMEVTQRHLTLDRGGESAIERSSREGIEGNGIGLTPGQLKRVEELLKGCVEEFLKRLLLELATT